MVPCGRLWSCMEVATSLYCHLLGFLTFPAPTRNILDSVLGATMGRTHLASILMAAGNRVHQLRQDALYREEFYHLAYGGCPVLLSHQGGPRVMVSLCWWLRGVATKLEAGDKLLSCRLPSPMSGTDSRFHSCCISHEFMAETGHPSLILTKMSWHQAKVRVISGPFLRISLSFSWLWPYSATGLYYIGRFCQLGHPLWRT
jgi:hypothetical protein